MRASPLPLRKDKPTVLLILQGAHHLELYRSILTQCDRFQWVCLIHDFNTVSPATIRELHATHGTLFFSDPRSALAHFGDIDAVVTTFAVPHLAHITYLDFIALAYELGLPVFELQHGLFQLGISLSTTGAIVGAGMPAGQNALPVRNLTDRQLRWWGPDGIGYPPFCGAQPPDPDLTDAAGAPDSMPDNTPDNAPGDAPPEPVFMGPVTFMTNFQSVRIPPAETAAGYEMILTAILTLPDIRFVIAPHPSEVTSPAFRRLLNRLDKRGTGNHSVIPASDSAGRRALLRQTRLAVASASTILLDLEMLQVPTLLFDLPCFSNLTDSFASCVRVGDGAALVAAIIQTVYEGDHPTLRTGVLVPFAPRRLEAMLAADMPASPLPANRYVPLINRYIRNR